MKFNTVANWFKAKLESIGSPRVDDLRSQLAELGVDVSPTTIANWKHGHNTPKPQHLAGLFEFFSASEYERNEVRIMWMRERESAGTTRAADAA